MSSLHLQEQLHQLTIDRIVEIRKMYPELHLLNPEFYSLDHRFNCSQIIGITEEIQAETSFFIVNIRGYIPDIHWGHKSYLSDYGTFTSDLCPDTVSLSCGNWYAEAFFDGDNVKNRLTLDLSDNSNDYMSFKLCESFYFADAFSHFHQGISDFSTRYSTLKLFKSNKNYQMDILRLNTGFVSRENAATRKFFKETDKYYKNVLGIGR